MGHGMLPISEEEYALMMPYIMREMRNRRWTYSDTPGMGNVAPWTIMQPDRMMPARPIQAPNGDMATRDDVIAAMPMTLEQRKALEKHLLDLDLDGSRQYLNGVRRGMLPIHHEQSETVPGPGGKWMNVYGSNTPLAGQQLPGTPLYDTVEEAVAAAVARSEAAGRRRGMIDGTMPPARRTPRTEPGGGGVRG